MSAAGSQPGPQAHALRTYYGQVLHEALSFFQRCVGCHSPYFTDEKIEAQKAFLARGCKARERIKLTQYPAPCRLPEALEGKQGQTVSILPSSASHPERGWIISCCRRREYTVACWGGQGWQAEAEIG